MQKRIISDAVFKFTKLSDFNRFTMYEIDMFCES